MATDALQLAATGEFTARTDLQTVVEQLERMPEELDPLIDTAPDIATGQAIGRTQQALRDMARDGVARQIDLIAGEARITSEPITSAVDYAHGMIEQIADVRKKLQKVGMVIDFFSAVLTGSGVTMVQAAVTPKEELDSA